jgi:hypothetical protein
MSNSRVIFAVLAIVTVSTPASAQWFRWGSRPAPWSLVLEGGGSYSVSDLEVVPGTDQNGGWSWDAGLRVERGRGAVGVGFERSRYDVGPDGSSTTSGIYVKPRFHWGEGRRSIRPYLFAHGAWIFDYDVTFCCSVYTANSNAEGWSFGGGFGVTTAPFGNVRFDLSASVDRLSGESDTGDSGAWKGAGPVVGVRLGASVPLFGAR